MRRLCFLLLAILDLSSPIGALEPDQGSLRELALEEVVANAFSVGDRIRLTARYTGIHGKGVVFLGTAARFEVRSPDVRRTVLDLTIDAENLTVEAVYASSVDSRPVFVVERVTAASSDEEVLEEAIRLLKSRGRRSGELLFRLANRISQTEEVTENEELHSLARRACSEGIDLLDENWPPDDAASRLKLIQNMYSIFPDRVFAMEQLAGLEKRFPRHAPIREFLLSLNCRKFQGKWMTYEEFKEGQGFVHDEKRGWLKRGELDFLLAVEEFQKSNTADLVLRNRLEEEYILLANKGETAVGMTAEEIHNARGYAERVYRKVIAGHDFDQWVYEDRYCYFYDGILFKVVRRDQRGRETPASSE